MLAYNRLDNLLTRVIEVVLHQLKRDDLVATCTNANYAQKVLTLDLLKQSIEGRSISQVPIQTMRDVGGHRNIVAHGHFDQNPHSGDYEIVGKKSYQYTPAQLDAQAAKTTEVWQKLRSAEAYYEFLPLLDEE